jgi:diguanylate cyclase (GGDEF)-like protein
MLALLIAAAAAALVVLAFVVARRARVRSNRRFEAVLRQVDDQLRPISRDLQRAADRTAGVRERGLSEREVTLDFEELERDELTGLRNRNAYEAELERAIARARRAGESLALVLLELDESVVPSLGEDVLRDFARVLTRVARARDTVCRRGPAAFAILLPDTSAEGASRLHGRVREEVAAAVAFSAGVAEWQPNETSDAFDARARAAVGTSFAQHLGRPAVDVSGPR